MSIIFQLEVSTPECIAVLHRLEQVSSEERVGSLSENLLEALATNEAVRERIEKVRIVLSFYKGIP
jgi:E3 ubiquitin-protein ligase UBR4